MIYVSFAAMTKRPEEVLYWLHGSLSDDALFSREDK